jgi:NhaP-type Na+/H+ or K+/H+ antiporter
LLTYTSSVVAAICAPVYIFYLPPVKPHGTADLPILEKLRALDWTGFIGGTGVAVTLTMVLTFAGSSWGWNDGRTIATFVVSGVLFMAVFLQQHFSLFTTPEARMFPPPYPPEQDTNTA